MDVTAWLGWILFGLIVGAAARPLMPGCCEPLGQYATLFLGVAGSVLGGLLAHGLRLAATPYEPGGWILCVLSAAAVLLSYHWMTSTRRAV